MLLSFAKFLEQEGDEDIVMFIGVEVFEPSKLRAAEERKKWVIEKFEHTKFRAPELLGAVTELPDIWIDSVSQVRIEK